MISPDAPAGYRRIADDLRGQIRDGILSAGQRIMSVKDLVQVYGVAQGTAERALQVLKDEGLIVSDRGRRSRVREQRQVVDQSVPRGGSDGPARRGTPEECRELGLPEGSMVTPVHDAGGRLVGLYAAEWTRFTHL